MTCFTCTFFTTTSLQVQGDRPDLMQILDYAGLCSCNQAKLTVNFFRKVDRNFAVEPRSLNFLFFFLVFFKTWRVCWKVGGLLDFPFFFSFLVVAV